MISCEEDQTGPKVNLSDAVKPAITTPSNQSTMVLTKPDEANLFTIQWTAANYKLDGLPTIKYTVLLEFPDNSTSTSLTSTNLLEYQIMYQILNQKLLNLGLVYGVENTVLLKVTSSISDFSTADELVSDPITLIITPYNDEAPPARPIYLLGSATLAGWNNTAALIMTPITEGKFEIFTPLTGGSGMFIKFLSRLGQWAPQWGTDATGTWDHGPLVYRPTEAVSDPPAIPAPPESGDYHVVCDTAELYYQVAAVANKLLISTTGLDGERVMMEKVKPLEFTITTTLSAGKELYINFEDKSLHSVYYNISSIVKPEAGKSIFSIIDMHTTGLIIPAPSVDGNYTININLRNLTYSYVRK